MLNQILKVVILICMALSFSVGMMTAVLDYNTKISIGSLCFFVLFVVIHLTVTKILK